MVLPDGFALPPLPYLLGLVVGAIGVAGLLYLLQPRVTNWTVVALAPWMALGGVLHGLEQLGASPSAVEPLFGAPAVYLTVAIATGLVWIVGVISAEVRSAGSADRTLGVIGATAFATFTGIALYWGASAGSLTPFWPVIGLVIAVVVAALAWLLLSLAFTESAAVTGPAGATVVVGHVLDGISTAVGYDVIPGASERTPLSRLLLEAGDALPTADLMGAGWLFVTVKIALAIGLVVLFREYVKEAPTQARLLLALLAAVGLGPGVQNLLLFAIAG